MKRSRIRTIAALAAVVALVGGACSDDNGDDDASGEAPTEEQAPEDETGSDDAASGEAIEITGVNYAYEGVPDTIAPGTELTLVNATDDEVHEIVALRVSDDETRSFDELLAAGEEELEGAVEEAGVFVAFPGDGPTITPFGPVVLEDPGRYILACFVPQGADPDEYAQAAQEATDGPPDVEGGPPHAVLGMVAEVTVG